MRPCLYARRQIMFWLRNITTMRFIAPEHLDLSRLIGEVHGDAPRKQRFTRLVQRRNLSTSLTNPHQLLSPSRVRTVLIPPRRIGALPPGGARDGSDHVPAGPEIRRNGQRAR